MSGKTWARSYVVVGGQPDGGFVRIPNAFIRCPHISPGPARVLSWLASQSQDWDVYVETAADQLGATRKTVARWIEQAAETTYLDIQPAGGLDKHGNKARIYRVDLTMECGACVDLSRARVRTTHERGSKVPTREEPAKTIQEEQSLSRSAEPTARAQTPEPVGTPHYLPDGWQPNRTHLISASKLGLDIDDVRDCFVCTDAVEDEKRSDWDKAFAGYINAFAEGRHDVDYPSSFVYPN